MINISFLGLLIFFVRKLLLTCHYFKFFPLRNAARILHAFKLRKCRERFFTCSAHSTARLRVMFSTPARAAPNSPNNAQPLAKR